MSHLHMLVFSCSWMGFTSADAPVSRASSLRGARESVVEEVFSTASAHGMFMVTRAGSTNANGYYGMFEEHGGVAYCKLDSNGSKQTTPGRISIVLNNHGAWDMVTFPTGHRNLLQPHAASGYKLYTAKATGGSSLPPVDGWKSADSGVGSTPQLHYVIPPNAVLEIRNAGGKNCNGFYGIFEESASAVYYKLDSNGSKQKHPATVSIRSSGGVWTMLINGTRRTRTEWNTLGGQMESDGANLTPLVLNTSSDAKMDCGDLYVNGIDDGNRPPIYGWSPTKCGSDPVPEFRYLVPPANAALQIVGAGSAEANGYYSMVKENGSVAYYKLEGDGSRAKHPYTISVKTSLGVWNMISSDDMMGCGLYSVQSNGSNMLPVDGWEPTECGAGSAPYPVYLASI